MSHILQEDSAVCNRHLPFSNSCSCHSENKFRNSQFLAQARYNLLYTAQLQFSCFLQGFVPVHYKLPNLQQQYKFLRLISGKESSAVQESYAQDEICLSASAL